ncbi:hypothetical protein [Natrinema sp. DC36]|uniref:hypothetical protein n=1 Tax=Natrinema sp. DC36 TaxID=2878680 RepID=UPI001CF051FD|nr:hypothetical protein [Natrinema sp. DC36]
MTFIADEYTVEVSGFNIDSDELTEAIMSVDGVYKCPIRLPENEWWCNESDIPR